MNNEQFMKELVASFPSPEPRDELIKKVRKQISYSITENKPFPRKVIAYIVAITVATLPLFSMVNYFYYIALEQFISTYFPQMLTSFVILFTISVTLIGAMCYGVIPIWIAYSMHNRVYRRL